MIVISEDSKLFEVDKELFEEVKEYLKSLSKKRKKPFSYIDELGDRIIVIGEKEYVEPTKEDLEAFLNEEEYMDEDEVKKLFDV